MNKNINVVKSTLGTLRQDCILFGKVVGSFLAGCFVACYVVGTMMIGCVWLSYSQGWATAWEPWAIMIAPYWTIGNLIFAFVSWIGYRTYQAVKNQK